MDHGRLVTVGAHTRVMVGGPASTPPSKAIAMPLGKVVRAATRGEADDTDVLALDVADDTVAVTADGTTEAGNDSVLLAAPLGGAWHVLVVEGTGGGALGTREVHAPQITATGIRAFVDGASDLPSYAARWSTSGALLRKVSGGSVGVTPIMMSAAYDGDILFTAPGFSCDDGCQVEAAGPVRLG